ncbi:hypothetical protein DPMN_056276 [Dreissena polymorpha]|uniref:Monocarboxylate transporter n=1 Tax=Dreissena polymorpha TaxID=45954 RepID=A0A9D4CRE0_DREPO|nr:hypothetical protein DPMN_056276 [Dreissena polymorpha]
MTVKEGQNEQESEVVQSFEPSPDLNERILNGTEPPVVCSHETPLKSENGLDKYVINKEDVQFNDMDRGWSWAVLFASFGSFMLIGSCMNGVGIIHATLLELHGESVGLTSWAGTLHTGLASLGAPISSAVLDRYSCRAALVLAGFLATAFRPVSTAQFLRWEFLEALLWMLVARMTCLFYQQGFV